MVSRVFNILFGKNVLVIIHEPGVGGKGNAVQLSILCQEASTSSELVDLISSPVNSAAEFDQGVGIRHGGQGVVGIHEHIRAGLRILGHLCVAALASSATP